MNRSGVAAHVIGWTLALSVACAAAQVRAVPADAPRGLIRHQESMIVTINGRPVKLAPGAQIRDKDNRIVLPAAVPADALVKYTLDPAGQVQRVWILTDAEAAQPDSRR